MRNLKIAIFSLSVVILILLHLDFRTINQKNFLLKEKESLEYLIDLKNEVINNNQEIIDSLTMKIDTLEMTIMSMTIVNNITATMYYPTAKQCDDDPHITADGSIIDVSEASKHRWIAVSRDLLSYNGGPFKYGDEVILLSKTNNKLKILGKYHVRDTMNKRWKRKIDILETPGTDLYKLNDITMIKI